MVAKGMIHVAWHAWVAPESLKTHKTTAVVINKVNLFFKRNDLWKCKQDKTDVFIAIVLRCFLLEFIKIYVLSM